MLPDFSRRSYELEHLDKGDYTPEEYEGCLVELRRINEWLGDAAALKGALFPEIDRAGLASFSALDVAAGSGELLRVAALEARARNLRARLVGLELDARAARAIAEESRDFPEIVAVRGDAFRLPFADASFDFVFCSLFAHHLRDEQLVEVLREFARVARGRLFVIDLERSRVAYLLYTTVGKLFLHNRLIREDGALSILRAFRPKELQALAERAGLKRIEVRKSFPARLVLAAATA